MTTVANMSPSPNWFVTSRYGANVYNYDARSTTEVGHPSGSGELEWEGVGGRWVLHYSPDIGVEVTTHDLGISQTWEDVLSRSKDDHRQFMDQVTERADMIIQRVDQEYARNDRSLVDKLGDRIRDALGARAESYESPSPNWSMEKTDGKTVYYRNRAQWEGYAAVWKDRGRWTMEYALDPQSPMFQADLGKTRSVEKALNRADLTIMSAAVEVHQNYEDVRTVVNLAKGIDDVTPEERASIDHLQEAIDQGPPPGALNPADDWLDTFKQDTQERDRDRDNDKGYGY